MINFRRQCYQRDSRLIDILKEWGVLDTEQIKLLLFPSIRVAQRRLSKLAQQNKIKRSTQITPYFYYIDANKNPLQRIAVNWARLWLIGKIKSWERTTFNYDTNTCTVINTVTGTTKEYYITDQKFKLPGDNNVININDDFISNAREVLRNE